MIGSPWKRQFALLWAGQSVSVLTSAVIQMSLVWYLTARTGSAAVMSAGTLMGFIPRALIGPFAGVLIDRFSRKRVMILADLFIAAMSLLPVAYGFFAELPVWVVMLTLFCRSLGSAFHTPALQAFTPAIVPREHLTGYAGFAHGFESVSHLISPALAALLFERLSLHLLMLLDVFGALFAVFLLGFVRAAETHARADGARPRPLAELREGLQVVRAQPAVLFVLVISCFYAALYSPIGTYYPLITLTHFGGKIGDSAWVETLLSLGTLAGAFTLGFVGNRLKKMRAFALSILTYGACVACIGALPPSMLPMFAGLSALVGASIPFYSGVRTAIIQTRCAPEYLGRVFALTTGLVSFATPVGLICAGLFAEQIGIARWFLLSGSAAVLLGLVSLASPLMREE